MIIIDGIENGKGSNKYINFGKTIPIYQLSIKNHKLIYNKQALNIINIDIIIFNYNEDLLTYSRNWDPKLTKKFKNQEDMISFFKKVSKLIKNINPKIILYQDPNKSFELGDKILVYNRIQKIKDPLFTIPKYKKINDINDLLDVDFYPLIIKPANESCSGKDFLCQHLKDAIRIYKKHFENHGNIFVVEFINSYIDKLKTQHSIRFMVSNNKLMEYHFRTSNNWNARAKNQIKNKISISESYYKNIYLKHKEQIYLYFDKINKIYGNCFFAYDVIYNEKQDKYYICEIGLKIIDETYKNYSRNYIDKLSFNEQKLIEHYKKTILN